MTITPPLTPPEYAKRLGVSPDKVVGWINAGELHAVNVATKAARGRRPRWIIPPESVVAFEQARSNATPLPRLPRAPRPKTTAGLIEIY